MISKAQAFANSVETIEEVHELYWKAKANPEFVFENALDDDIYRLFARQKNPALIGIPIQDAALVESLIPKYRELGWTVDKVELPEDHPAYQSPYTANWAICFS